MMPAIATVDIDCPRCDDKITCNLEAIPEPSKPGTKTADIKVRVVDLADKFKAHYTAAGHGHTAP